MSLPRLDGAYSCYYSRINVLTLTTVELTISRLTFYLVRRVGSQGLFSDAAAIFERIPSINIKEVVRTMFLIDGVRWLLKIRAMRDLVEDKDH